MTDVKNIAALYSKLDKPMPGNYSDSWYWRSYDRNVESYDSKRVGEIISSSNTLEKIRMSRSFFSQGGFYKSLILYYATLLKYAGVLLPNDKSRKGMKDKKLVKKYYEVMDYIDTNNFQKLCWNWAMRVLRDGAYYGVVGRKDKSKLTVLDLPIAFCSSEYKDYAGRDLIRFDLSYFDTIVDKSVRQEVLKSYPKYIRKNYGKANYVFIPSDQAIYFNLFGSSPYFLSTIEAILQYNDSLDIAKEKELDEVRKIITQTIPHLSDGSLLFEPEEAVEIHNGATKMLSKNSNISVLTGYANVDVISSKTSAENQSTIVEKMTNNLYASSGVSGQLFSLAGGQTLKASVGKDIALMMVLANQFAATLSSLINSVFGSPKLDFKYQILSISHQNEREFIDNSYKMVSTGYSFLMPALAMGISQKDLVNIKDLENNVLKLNEKLQPLVSSFQSSAKEIQDANTKSPGGQELPDDQKSDKTIKNLEAKENQGGVE